MLKLSIFLIESFIVNIFFVRKDTVKIKYVISVVAVGENKLII